MSKYYMYADDDSAMPVTEMQFNGVTVLMNSYNEKEVLFRRAVESVFQANPCQLILSTVKGDKCMEWITDYLEYPIRIVENDKPGIFEQLNAMLPHIRGKYVCYASSNDIMLPHKLSEEAGILRSTGKKVCYSAFEIIERGGNRTIPAPPYSYERNLQQSYISDCALVEVKTFLKYTPFVLEYKNYAYLDLWLRIFEGEGEVFIPNNNPTWVYHITKQSQHIRRKRDKNLQREYLRHRTLMLKDHVSAATKILGEEHLTVHSIINLK